MRVPTQGVFVHVTGETLFLERSQKENSQFAGSPTERPKEQLQVLSVVVQSYQGEPRWVPRKCAQGIEVAATGCQH